MTPPESLQRDRRWERFVQDLRSGNDVPFERQLAFFREIHDGRPESAGPPPAWSPGPDEASGSNLARFLDELGFDDYASLHAWSVRERAEFWKRTIERLGIVLRRPPERILDDSHGVRDPRWLPGATLNCVDSCFRVDAGSPAIVSAAEGQPGLVTQSYGDLRERVGQVVRGLHAHGFEPGDAIAVYMPMTADCVAAYLGIVLAGCRVVSIADSFSPQEVSRRLKIGGARGIVTVDCLIRAGKRIPLYAKVIEARGPRAIVIPTEQQSSPDLRRGDRLWEDFLRATEPFEPPAGDPRSVINVLFSSGTTGEPKAIPWNHLTSIKCAMDGHFHLDVRPGDVVAWPTNIGWMMGPWLIFAALINRATIALYEGAPVGEGFARFVADAQVTMLGLVPSLVRHWRSSRAVARGQWEGVRVFGSTGEPSHREDYLWLMSRAHYRAPVIEYCGGTEIGGGYLTGTVLQPASPATFTTPALGLDLFVLDPNGSPVEEGESGEVFLVPPSIGLSQQLLNGDHDRVYHEGCPTGPGGEILRRHGDRLVRLHGGFYRAQGRSDDTMNLGGIKVAALELEQAMAGHPALRECAAVAVRIGDEGSDRLVVFAVVAMPVRHDRLRQELGRRIGERLNPLFKIHDLVIVASLPRTASNKLLRRELRDRYRQTNDDAPRPARRSHDHEVNSPEIHLNLNVRGLLPSATVAINERSDGLRSAGRRIFKMGLGQSPFPVPDLLVRALQENAHQKDYLPVKGLPELRRQIAEHHRKTLGIGYTEEDVMVGPGSKELMFLLQLAYYGDLLVPTPTWVSYVPQARIIGRRVRFLRTRAAQGWQLTPSRLDEQCRADPHRPRILILNYPSNPTGLTYRPRELEELADVAKRYRVILLSDEIYGALHHQGEHSSIVPFYPSGTILSGGLSKWCGAGGWRLGFFVFPPALRWLLDAMTAVASETYTSTCAPIQYAAVPAFRNGGELDRYLFQSRRILRGLARAQVALLREAGVRVFAPHGAFYLFPDFRHEAGRLARRGIQSSTELAERLLEETGVAVLPGRAFGRSDRELNARLAYVNFDGARALAAAASVPDDEELDDAFLCSNCPDVLEGVERICEWVNR